jgi:hypothetical protein
MSPIPISRDQAIDLLDGNHFSLEQMAFFITSGSDNQIYENLEITYFDITVDLPEKISSIFESWNAPTILALGEESTVCPASLTVASCNDTLSIPLYDFGVASRELDLLFSLVPQMADDSYPVDTAAQQKVWADACDHLKCRALGLLSSYFARTPDGLTPAWFFSKITRIADDEVEPLTVVFTGMGVDNLYSVNCWDEYWNGLEDHEGPVYRTTWKTSSRIEVTERDTQNDLVSFQLIDEDGHESFRASSNAFEDIKQFLLTHGWTYVETTATSTTSVVTNSNFGRVHGDVNINSSRERDSAISPTPHTQPTQQPPGAPVESGIISGNVNITGLAQLNGIVQGDVIVPSGSDVNLNGIVQGTVWVNGGTARLFGTISHAAISSGRIEIYGILQSPLQYNGGDVYFHPNSIIG